MDPHSQCDLARRGSVGRCDDGASRSSGGQRLSWGRHLDESPHVCAVFGGGKRPLFAQVMLWCLSRFNFDCWALLLMSRTPLIVHNVCNSTSSLRTARRP